MHLSEKDKKIGGVCGGIAESLGMDSSIVRIIAVLLLIVLHMVVLIAYIILWMVLPKE